MQIRLFLLSLCALLNVHICFGQEGEVVGTVTDVRTGEALVGVTVVSGPGTGAATDIDGNYRFTLPAGKYSLKYTYVGYEQLVKEIQVLAGQIVVVDAKMKQTSQALDIVVVSAGKFEQDYGDITVSMEVLKPQMIENRNTVNIDQVLQQTPGVSIVDGEPQIRSGSGYSFGAGSRVMVLLDDLPILSGDAGRPSWGFLPIENLEQVEVIKGASSVLYGSAALSGVVNMRTAYPKEKPQTKITAFTGMYSDPQTAESKYWDGQPMQVGAQFLHSRRVGQWDLVVGGNFLGDDGHLGPIVNRDSLGAVIDTSSSRFNPFQVNRNAAETRVRLNANVRYRFKNTPGLTAGVNTNWLKGESLATLVWENIDNGLYNAFDGSATRTKQVIGTVDPFVEYVTESGSSHSLRGRWQKLDNDNDNNQGNFSDVYFGQYQFQQNFDRWGIENMTATAGLIGILTFGESQLYAGDNAEGDNEAKNYAAFLQVDKTIKERLTVSAGVRYEYFEINGQSEAKPVFRSGVNYQFGIASWARASFGQGYRFPSIAEKFIQTAVGVINIYSNPELQSETSWNAEVGVKQGFKIGDFGGFIDLALFRQEYENFIEFTFGQWNPEPDFNNLLGLGFKSVNTGRARVDGADFSVMAGGKIGEIELNLLGGYTYTVPVSLTPDLVYARNEVSQFPQEQYLTVSYASTSSDPRGNILKYRMQHLIRFDAEATWKDINLGGSVRYNSFMQNIDQAFQDIEEEFPDLFGPGINEWRTTRNQNGDFVIDMRLGYRIKEKHRVMLVVSNVLNREYAIRPLAIEPGRLSVIQYSVSF